MQQTLSIDIETYSSEDLKKSGVYRYAEASDFSILLFGFAFNDEPIQVIDLVNGEALPEKVLLALSDETILKTAFNANFEVTCIKAHFSIDLDITQWECTMVKSAMLGLPLSLDAVSTVLKLEQEKMKASKALIRYFCLPCKATKTDHGRTRNLPHHDTDKWDLFKTYCGMDVEVERAIRSRISFFEIPQLEKELWYLDHKTNKTGVRLDSAFVDSALHIYALSSEELMQEAKQLSGLDNPNSPSQLKDWLSDKIGDGVETLRKDDIPTLMDGTDCLDVKRMLELRQEMSKTSVKKYQAMANTICSDGRVRGITQFYGANRTGRYAGRLIQVQNLARNYLKDLELARDLVLNREFDILKLTFGDIPDTLSQLLRTAFIASEGCILRVSDFSAIEARVLAWWAKEKWRLDIFNSHGKIYEASAAAMFGVPMSDITSELRSRGKVAELALGYQGSVGALSAMDIKKELSEEEKPRIVASWRKANQRIVQHWYAVDRAIKNTIMSGVRAEVNGVFFYMHKGILFVRLPSGRNLAYPGARVVEKQTKVGLKEAIQYYGVDDRNKWNLIDSYGGKFVENITQAIARDCLTVNLVRLEDAGYCTVFHVHDEAVIDTPLDFGSLEDVCEIMSQPIEWAKGLPMRAEGFSSPFYKKE